MPIKDPDKRRERDRDRKRIKRATDPVYAERERERKREGKRIKRATDPVYAERERERKRIKYVTDPVYAERERERKRIRRATDPVYNERERERQRKRLRIKRATDPVYAERKREGRRKWGKNNPDRVAAKSAERRASKVQATPAWLTDEHRREIDRLYAISEFLSKETGVTHNVDHIVPINGKMVCGLHVPWNLRVVTGPENLSKNNALDEEISQPAAVFWVFPAPLPIPQISC